MGREKWSFSCSTLTVSLTGPRRRLVSAGPQVRDVVTTVGTPRLLPVVVGGLARVPSLSTMVKPTHGGRVPLIRLEVRVENPPIFELELFTVNKNRIP